jgi:hypothetical protein
LSYLVEDEVTNSPVHLKYVISFYISLMFSSNENRYMKNKGKNVLS